MSVAVTRRLFLGMAGSTLGTACCATQSPSTTPEPLALPTTENRPSATAPSVSAATGADMTVSLKAIPELQALEARIGGRLGLFAHSLSGSEPLAHRADERFAMCSTFKWVLAAAVLRKIDRGDLALTTPVAFGEADLLQYAPVTRPRVQEGQLTLEELMKAAITVSDNTAANLLLNQIAGPQMSGPQVSGPQVSGPQSLTQFLRDVGDPTTRLDRNEPMLNTNFLHDERDTTTPRAMAQTLMTVLTGTTLLAPSRELLSNWLVATTTGLGRLRGGLPPTWKAGDKTGTGENGACNDVAVIWPPNCAPWFVASYLSESTAPNEVLFNAHAEIGRIVTAHIGACS